jgi:arylsulfatase
MSTPVGEAATDSRPNIVLIMSDDMGFSDIGCYGGEIETPSLDGLAASGLRFSQFYNTARCCPTRASLLTGLYPHQAGMGHMTYDGRKAGYEGDLSRNALTIAEALRPAGYRTYMSGKWHVTRFSGKDGPKDNWPLQRGFDQFYGTITGAGSFFDPTTLARSNTFITPDNDPEYQPQQFYYTDAISDNAVAYLRRHADEDAGRPFFLYVAYTAAHWPMHALPKDIAKYKGRYDGGYAPIRQARLERARQLGLISDKWSMTSQAANWDDVQHKAWEARCMEVYAAMVDSMDQGISRIVDELKRQDQFDNTLVFFLQDNGGCAEGMGRRSNAAKIKDVTYKPFGPDDLQPKIWPPMQTRDGRPVRTGPEVMPGAADTYIAYGRGWANVSNTPFREYKHWVHEGGIATPLIIHWPAGMAADQRNRIVHEPGHLVDIMATCVDVGDVAYPQQQGGRKIQPLEGASLRPTFKGSSIERSVPIFWEHEGNRAVRNGKWKLVAKGPGGPWELYDMEADRTETNDLAAAHPDIVQNLRTEWEAWARRAKVIPWIWKKPYRSQPAATTKPAKR